MFYCPTRIIFAEHAIKHAESILATMGKCAFIVSGQSSARLSGALDELMPMLGKLNIASNIYDQITENPTVQDVIRGSKLMTDQQCDFVIGIGGGSPIDAAKAISLAAANQLSEGDLYSTDKFISAYPIVAIPTTAGTGTEATQYSVLTNPATNKKAGFGHPYAFPRLSIVDARYTHSLSAEVTLHTALDALSHLLEGLYSNQRSSIMYPFIYRGISSIIKQLPIVLRDAGNKQARAELMQASLYGGMVIAQSSTTLQHSIGYPLTTEYHVAHGLANAMVMEDIMNLYQDKVQDELSGLFNAISITKEGFISWLNALPFRKGILLSDSFIEAAIPQIMASRNMALNPLEVMPGDIRNILHKLKERS